MDEENEAGKEEMISVRYLSLNDVHDVEASHVIRDLLNKTVSKRMTLEEFMVITYYIINRVFFC